MIVINITYGQNCNQLFLFSHMLAHGMSTGRRVWFPGFFRTQSQFEYFVADRKSWSQAVYLPFKSASFEKSAERILRRLFHRQSKLLRLLEKVTGRRCHVSLDFLQESMLPESENGGQLTSPICFFEGWQFRVPQAFRTFAPQLRSIFRYRRPDIDHARDYIKSLPQPHLIGVHIRQSDYAGTSHYYTPARYFEWMTMLKDQLGDVGFVVVSDGSLPDFGKSWIHVHRGSAVEDLCLLSHCDRVMGAPSTFNRWAAFMGEKPHLCLWSESQVAVAADFARFKMLDASHGAFSSGELKALNYYGIV